MISKIKENKAITLIALIITIIVLLILAGVVINMTLGNEGIISKAQSSVDKYKNEQEKEEMQIAKYEEMIDGNRNNSSKFNLEIYLDGVKVDDIPDKSTSYIYYNSECPEGVEVAFDNNNWRLNIYNISTTNATIKVNFTQRSMYALLLESLDDDTTLNYFFTTPEYISKIVAEYRAMDLICKTVKLKQLVYNNYTLWETKIQNSSDAIEAMTDNAELKSVVGTARDDNTTKTIYSNQAFVLSVSHNGNSSEGTVSFGEFRTGNKYTSPTAGNSYGTDGTRVQINKFASVVKAYRSNCSAHGTYYYYAKIIPINE